MNKEAFLYTLRQELNGLPEEDLEERLGFYDEMIEDLVDEGLSEEEAVAKMGNAEAIAQQIMKDRPSMSVDTDTIKEKAKTIFNNIFIFSQTYR